MILEQIRNLDDAMALRLVDIIAKTRIQSGGAETQVSPDMIQALEAEFGASTEPGKVTPGDLARATLLLLAQDPDNEPMLLNLLIGSDEKVLGVDPITATMAVTAALVILQTEVNIERDKQGRWTFSLKKKSASDGLLKEVVGKLTGLMSK